MKKICAKCLREFLAPVIPEEGCVIVGLLQEVGKPGLPDKLPH